MGSVCHDDLCICPLYCMCNCFGVVVLHRLEEGGGVNLQWIYMDSAIYETYVV